MGFENIDGERDIKPGTITDASVSPTAGIQETKLALDYTTVDLHDNAVRIDEDRTIQDNIYVTFPVTGFKMVDAVDGKTYLFTLQNGVLKAEQL